MIKKLFTQRDIMELLNITASQFRWHIKKLNIKYISNKQKIYFYTYQDLIDVYKSIYIIKRIMIVDSKMNYKKMKL